MVARWAQMLPCLTAFTSAPFTPGNLDFSAVLVEALPKLNLCALSGAIVRKCQTERDTKDCGMPLSGGVKGNEDVRTQAGCHGCSCRRCVSFINERRCDAGCLEWQWLHISQTWRASGWKRCIYGNLEIRWRTQRTFWCTKTTCSSLAMCLQIKIHLKFLTEWWKKKKLLSNLIKALYVCII